jgi:DNA polymerase-1
LKEDYKKIFDSLGKESEQEEETQNVVNDRVLIVDSLNMFLRSFTVIQHLNKSGNHIGGLTGYLRSLSYVISLVRPSRVILTFDGQGSSTNKRYIYPEYKANRGIRRITNWDSFENQEQESEAITNQLVRLIDYLKCLPVDLLSIDKVEADDVIGYLVKELPTSNITIVSSDRDYLQLISPNVEVYSPTKKIFYNQKRVLEEYKIPAHNFLTQKIILGDAGDNVPGVNGVGIKTLLKSFPELSTQNTISLEELIEKSENTDGKVYQKILAFKNQLFVNRLLMDLQNPNIPEESIEFIKTVLDNPNRNFHSREFQILYNEDDLGNSINNLQTWLYTAFNELSKT